MQVTQTLLLTFILLLGACSKHTTNRKLPEPSLPSEAKVTPQTLQHETFDGRLNKQNVQIKFEEGGRGIYNIVISWPVWSHGVRLILDEQNPVFVKDRNYFRQPILSGSEVSVELFTLNEVGDHASSFYSKVQSPTDLIIEKDIHLSARTNLEANRIFFVNTSKIFTHGHSLFIKASLIQTKTKIQHEAKRLSLLESHIVTRLPGEIAKSMSELGGARVEIQAKKAIGQLNIAMVGINGNDRMFGGRVGSLDVFIDDYTEFRLGALLIPGEAGKGPWVTAFSPNNFVLECDRSTHVDKNGYNLANLAIDVQDRALCLAETVQTNTESPFIYDATQSDPKRK